jgi:hypothetical protein
MRVLSLIAVLFLGLILVMVRCEDPSDMCDFTEIEKCHRTQNPDSLTLANSLIGKWIWSHSLECTWSGTKDITSYAGHRIEFRADGTFVVYWPENTISNLQWKLNGPTGNGWTVVNPAVTRPFPEPPHGSLRGFLRVCGDNLLARDDYRDGGDNFLVRE